MTSKSNARTARASDPEDQAKTTQGRAIAAPHDSVLTLDDLTALVSPVHGLAVSIYLPTHRGGPDARQDHIRLKNLIAEMSTESSEVEPQLQAMAALAAAPAFWAHPAEGLVLLGDHGGVRRYWIPEPMPEIALAGRTRYLKPLLPLLAGDGSYHVLELHQGGVRLHQGSRFGLREIPLHVTPASAEELSHRSGDRRDVEGRTASHGGGGTIWFGGAHEEGTKERAERFFRVVDTAVLSQLHGSNAPLVLAGLEWLIPLYKQANRHPHLIDQGVPIDTASLDAHELHRRTWAIVQPTFSRRQQQTEERHAALRGTGRSAEILADVLVLAAAGRVESLLIASDRNHWGTCASDLSQVVQHDSRQAGDEDLINLAAVTAVRMGSRVYAVPAARIGGDDVTAVLRY